MPRPAHRPGGLRHLGVAVLCAVLSPLVSACTSGPDVTVPQQRPAAAPAAPARVSYEMPADAASMVLPTTGEGTRRTQGLDAFGRLAASWAVDGCAHRHGETVPDFPPPMFTRLSALPDLDFLRVHGFGGGADVPGAPPVTPPVTGGPPAAPSPAMRQCLSEGQAVGQELPRIYGPLQSQWFREIAPIDRAPEVRRAYLAFGDCLAAHQVDAEDEQAFFALVDQRLQAADAAGAQRLGAVYATCMKPVEAVREPLRAKAATRFRVSHSAQIDRVRTELPKKIDELEKRYGIHISFPEA